MKKRIFWAVWVVALLVIAQACEKAHAMVLPVHVRAVELWQSADSAYFAIVWNNQTLKRGQLPIGAYQTRITNVAGDTLAVSSVSAPATSDTLALPWPVLGDTLLIRGAVLAVDMEGNEAVYPDGSVGWALSSAFQFYFGVVPPSPVDSVFILPIDTIPEIIGWHVRPLIVVEVRDLAQYCLMVEFADGTKAYSNWHFTDEQEAYCLTVYNRWLTEVEG